MTISIRLLGRNITRSRQAVNTHIDPALKPLALKSVKELKIDKYGTENGFFGACLSENFNSWEDINNAYPRIAEEVNTCSSCKRFAFEWKAKMPAGRHFVVADKAILLEEIQPKITPLQHREPLRG